MLRERERERRLCYDGVFNGDVYRMQVFSEILEHFPLVFSVMFSYCGQYEKEHSTGIEDMHKGLGRAATIHCIY